MSTPTPQPVQSLVRGLQVIRSFGPRAPRQSLSEVATATGLARATARRFLHTLVGEGYAATNGSEFWLTPKVLELGYSFVSGLGLPALAQPHLESLSQTIDESSSLSVLDGADVVYVCRVPVRRIMTVNITVGTRFPAHATSMGRVLLAGLDDASLAQHLDHTRLEALTPRTVTSPAQLREVLHEVRLQGYSLVDQELELGLRSIAAPVTDPHGKVVAAVNISTQTASYDLEHLETTLIPALLRTTQAISADITHAKEPYHA